MQLDGREISIYSLRNSQDMEVSLSNYGARIVRILVPDSTGKVADVVLGYDSIEHYPGSSEGYYGATIGRFGNRIANGTFALDNVTYKLLKNDTKNHLHGGNRGFHSVVWKAFRAAENQVIFRHTFEDGEDGYPGRLRVEVSFSLNDSGELSINYQAVTDRKTIINLTNHAYFNLAGAGSGSVAGHLITINADSFTPVDEFMIPTGEIKKVAGTALDFRKEKPMSRDWDQDDPQLKIAGGYDHNFVLNKKANGQAEFAARVTEPVSGRTLEVETTEPGLQFYTANALDGRDVGREGVPYEARTAFCLETQHYPDSPNKPEFPSVLLEPGKPFKSTTIYRFSW